MICGTMSTGQHAMHACAYHIVARGAVLRHGLEDGLVPALDQVHLGEQKRVAARQRVLHRSVDSDLTHAQDPGDGYT